jgi:DNA-binding transcriptional ArsR family regulator
MSERTHTDEGPPSDGTDPRLEGRVLDAGALKALAHPLRFQLIELMIEHGPSTATSLGRLVGESSGSTSYHLRQLAKHGLIEEAPELGSARDRWWRVVKGGWTIDGFDVLQQPETRDDAHMVLDEVVRARIHRLRRWHRDAPAWGEDWVRSTVEMTGRFRLTREELDAMSRELIAVVDRFRDLQHDRYGPTSDLEGAVPVTVQIDAFPTADPPGSSSAVDVDVYGPAAATDPTGTDRSGTDVPAGGADDLRT